MRRASNFHGFIGQGKIVRFLGRQLHGALTHGDPCPHLLLIGPSGMGKTRLAEALAKEYGTECRIVLGKATRRQLCEVAITLRKGDFFFFDEAHRLPRDVQEALFELIDSGKLTDHLGDPQAGAPKDKDGKLVIPPVCVVLATDQPGALLNALEKRMQHRIHLNNYSERELTEIATSAATKIGVVVSAQAMHMVAKASQGQPRRAEHILKGLRLHFPAKDQSLGNEHVRKYLAEADWDAAGLDQLQRKYLFKLRRFGKASLETLAHLLGVDADYATSKIEPGLLKLGFIRIGRTGRCLTPAGKDWFRDWKEKRREKRGKHEVP